MELWAVESRKVSVLTDGKVNDGFKVVEGDDSSGALSELPPSLRADSGSTYESSQTRGNNTEKTFYTAKGEILGYSNVLHQ